MPATRPLRPLLSGLLALLVVVGTALAAVPTAEAATGFTITGKVTDADGGAPLADIPVTLYTPDPETGEWSETLDFWASTKANGTYTLKGITPGNYRVRFSDEYGDYIDQYWNGVDSLDAATTIAGKAGQVKSNVNAQLDKGGVISGRVLDPDNQPQSDVRVVVYRSEGGSWQNVLGDGSSYGTDEDGLFRAPGLDAGTYRVGATDEHTAAEVFYNGSRTLAGGTNIAVTEGQDKPLGDLKLLAASAISGHVTDSAGDPLEMVQVTAAHRVNGKWTVNGACSEGRSDELDHAATDENGDYVLYGLDPGEYRIQFCDFGNGADNPPRAFEYWDNAPSLSAGTSIDLDPYEVVKDVNAKLEAGGSISGTATAPGGKHPTCFEVDAFEKVGAQWVLTPALGYSTGTHGAYVVQGLNTGTYRLRFADGDCGSDYSTNVNWATSFSGNAASIDDAADVQVTRGQNTPGTNLTVQPGGEGPAGDLIGRDGKPAGGLVPTVYRKVGDTWTAYRSYEPTDDDEGGFDIEDVQVGTYRLGFVDPDGVKATDFWGSDNVNTAREFTVTQGQRHQYVDITLGEKFLQVSTAPSVSGTATVGHTLTAKPGTYSPAATTLTYRWLANGTSIKGATKKTFVPTAAQVKKRLSVRVSASSAGYSPLPVTSPATAAVSKRAVSASLSAANNNKGADVLKVKTGQKFTAKATVKVYRKSGRSWTKVKSGHLNGSGAASFTVSDSKKSTKASYYAQVAATGSTNADKTKTVSIK